MPRRIIIGFDHPGDHTGEPYQGPGIPGEPYYTTFTERGTARSDDLVRWVRAFTGDTGFRQIGAFAKRGDYSADAAFHFLKPYEDHLEFFVPYTDESEVVALLPRLRATVESVVCFVPYNPKSVLVAHLRENARRMGLNPDSFLLWEKLESTLSALVVDLEMRRTYRVDYNPERSRFHQFLRTFEDSWSGSRHWPRR